MGEFQQHHLQKRLRYLPLCDFCVTNNLTVKHSMVDISGLGDECVWHGTDDEHRPADWLVDLRCED